MTLVELAEVLCTFNELVYDENGTCISKRHLKPYPYYRVDDPIWKLHDFYSVETDGKLHTLGVEGNVMFCLLVNEATK